MAVTNGKKELVVLDQEENEKYEKFLKKHYVDIFNRGTQYSINLSGINK